MDNNAISSFPCSYRMAWEAPFPASIDDVTDAAVWFMRNLDQYNIDPDRIAVAGDSAGGNLAAALCQRLTYDKKYKDLPKMKFQGWFIPPCKPLISLCRHTSKTFKNGLLWC